MRTLGFGVSYTSVAASEVVKKSGWKQNEIVSLISAIDTASKNGAPLRGVFESMSLSLGRKPDSIRNFYYAQLRDLDGESRKRSAPFQPFQEDEMRELLRSILAGIASGKSVRSCVIELSGGSKSKMLRYQNKYRNLIKSRPDMVSSILEELNQSNPSTKTPTTDARLSRKELGAIGFDSDAALSVKSGGSLIVDKSIHGQGYDGERMDVPDIRSVISSMERSVEKTVEKSVESFFSRSSLFDFDRQMQLLQVRQDMLLSELNSIREQYFNLRLSVVPLVNYIEIFIRQNPKSCNTDNLTKIKKYLETVDRALASK